MAEYHADDMIRRCAQKDYPEVSKHTRIEPSPSQLRTPEIVVEYLRDDIYGMVVHRERVTVPMAYYYFEITDLSTESGRSTVDVLLGYCVGLDTIFVHDLKSVRDRVDHFVRSWR